MLEDRISSNGQTYRLIFSWGSVPEKSQMAVAIITSAPAAMSLRTFGELSLATARASWFLKHDCAGRYIRPVGPVEMTLTLKH